MSDKTAAEAKFVPRLLPWLIAAAFLVIYLLTLNPWLALGGNAQHPYSTSSLFEVGKVAGWTWQADLDEPLYWLVTYPFRWLPQNYIPKLLNLFSAICAVLVLANLARSVAILPHDRTEEQRSRERSPFSMLSIRTAWVPPILAVIVCGLQLSFWEHATAASGEIFALLLFSYLIRCLLEYRLDGKQSWLSRAAFLFSASMANSWGMVGFFPVFVAALIWVKGLSFFNVRFLTRMAAWGLTGLLFYLLLPIVSALSSGVEVGFWQALKYNLIMQKTLLFQLPFNKFTAFKAERPLWVLLLPSFVPVVIMGIRWPSYFGDPSRLGVGVATLTFHFFHAVLLGLCLYCALDPQFSPRHMIFGTPVLTFYYLGALSVGYLCGYFLLIFGAKPLSRMRPGLPSIPLINGAVLAVLWALMLVVPAALIYRNLPYLKLNNSILERYAEFSAKQLPKGDTVVLSDDPRKLFVMRSALAREGADKGYVFVDTASMYWPDYHRFMKKQYPRQWPANPAKDVVKKIDDYGLLIQILAKLAQSNQVYYLHPSFGYYFEAFYPEPQGMVYKLHFYPTNALFAPPPSPPLIATNEQIWAHAADEIFGPLITNSITIEKAEEATPAWPNFLLKKLALKPKPNWDALVVSSFYSRALNFWGVAMQREGKLPEAAVQFERALRLNPQNIVARVNLECNQRLQAGELPSMPGTLEERFGNYRDWDSIMNEHGPFDEPVMCSEAGQTYLASRSYRQAADQFARVQKFLDSPGKLRPDDASRLLLAKLSLAQIYVAGLDTAQALKLIEDIHSRLQVPAWNPDTAHRLLRIETSAHLIAHDLTAAELVVSRALQQYPSDKTVLRSLLGTAAQVYMQYGHYTNAIQRLDEMLNIPREKDELADAYSSSALINKGYAFLQLGQFSQAVAPLTEAIKTEGRNDSGQPSTNTVPGDLEEYSQLYKTALLNRAIAYLRSDQLDLARQDYETLQKIEPTEFRIHYGLGEIAYRKRDTNAAITSYNLYLENAPTNTTEAKEILRRLQELGPGSQSQKVSNHSP